MTTQLPSIIFTFLIAVLSLFQLGLALGAPWGEYAMGGYFPGKYPLKLRIASVVQVLAYILILLIVLSRAGIILPQFYEFTKVAIWVIVALLGLGVVMNLISKSIWEKRIWTPVALGMFLCALVIALS